MVCWAGVGLKPYFASGIESKAAIRKRAYCPPDPLNAARMGFAGGCAGAAAAVWAESAAGAGHAAATTKRTNFMGALGERSFKYAASGRGSPPERDESRSPADETGTADVDSVMRRSRDRNHVPDRFSRMKNARSSGFTLIELLIVVAII